jgi:hypothetical protein
MKNFVLGTIAAVVLATVLDPEMLNISCATCMRV